MTTWADPLAVDPRYDPDPLYEALMAATDPDTVSPASILDLFTRPAWYADAACREHPELSWHPDRGQKTAPAKAICQDCLVRPECLDAGLEDAFGIWGGLSPQERQKERLRRRRAS